MEPKLLNKLKEEYISGKSLNTLCDKYSIPKSTLYYNLSKFNIIRKTNTITKLNCNSELLIGTFIGIWAGDGSKFRDRGRYVTKIQLHRQNLDLIEFIGKIIKDLFGKSASLCLDGGNRASLRIYNKFIHQFIKNYLSFEDNKCLTISLRNKIEDYSQNFLNGFILGLTLSDGSIKRNVFVYSTISKKLKNNVINLLISKKYSPKLYVHKRTNYGWYDLNQVRLQKYPTTKIIYELNGIISQLGYQEKLEKLKTK